MHVTLSFHTEGYCIYLFLLLGYGTVFPRTAGGQMFCVVFAAIGIPLTIIVFKHLSQLVFLPFEKLGNYLESKGVSEVRSLSFHGLSHIHRHIW